MFFYRNVGLHYGWLVLILPAWMDDLTELTWDHSVSFNTIYCKTPAANQPAGRDDPPLSHPPYPTTRLHRCCYTVPPYTVPPPPKTGIAATRNKRDF